MKSSLLSVLFLLLFISCDENLPPALKIQSVKLTQSVFQITGEKLNLIDELALSIGGKTQALTKRLLSNSLIEARAAQSFEVKTDEPVKLLVKAKNGATAEIPLTIVLPANSVGLSELKLTELEAHFDARYAGGGESKNCPPNYVRIPGSAIFGTKDFCLMKYEAKSGLKGAESKPEASPLEPVSITLASALCGNLGAGHALPTNAQWMTVATNIAQQAENWSGGAVGSGKVNAGHADNAPATTLAASSDDNDGCYLTGESCDKTSWHEQRRTHRLSTGEYLWDFAGNAWEYVSWYVYKGRIGESTSWRKLSSFTTADETDHMKLLELRPTQAASGFWDDSWDEVQGFGRYQPQKAPVGGVAVRGGSYQMGPYAGLFALMMKFAPTEAAVSVGFRCVYNL